MNITRKSTPDPIAAIKNHDGGMLWALQAAEEVTGKPGLAVVLKQAGLEYMIDNFPENNNQVTGKYTLGEYADLNVGLLNFFGRGGRSMVMRIGRASQALGMEQFNNAFGAAGIAALRLLPEGMRAQKALEVVKFGFEKFFTYQGVQPLKIRVEDRTEKVAFIIETCGCCAGYTADVPICYMFTGYFAGGLQVVFAKGEQFDVKEVECRAMGAPACVWEMNKLPLKE